MKYPPINKVDNSIKTGFHPKDSTLPNSFRNEFQHRNKRLTFSIFLIMKSKKSYPHRNNSKGTVVTIFVTNPFQIACKYGIPKSITTGCQGNAPIYTNLHKYIAFWHPYSKKPIIKRTSSYYATPFAFFAKFSSLPVCSICK